MGSVLEIQPEAKTPYLDQLQSLLIGVHEGAPTEEINALLDDLPDAAQRTALRLCVQYLLNPLVEETQFPVVINRDGTVLL